MRILFKSKSGVESFVNLLIEQESDFTFERGFNGCYWVIIQSILSLKVEHELQFAELIGDAVVETRQQEAA